MMSDLAGELRNRDDFAVVTHLNPDGDALGSVFAMDMALREMGKKSCVVLAADLPKKYEFSELKARYILASDAPKKFGCVIAVDCADIRRLGDTRALFGEAEYTVNIDHHSSNEGFAKLNHIVPEPSSGEIIYDLIGALGLTLDADMAAALYVAISSDTGNFSYDNTRPETFERCAKIAATGIPIASIANHLYNARTYESTLLIGKVIQNLRLYFDGRLAVTCISLEELALTGASAEDCETVINYARDIDTVELAVFIRQFKENMHKVSFRSKNDIDVMEIAQRFGGGGHKKASGCAMSGDINDIMDTVLGVSKEFFR
jgi:phosphoesterase RecJ-like protein